MKNEELKRNNTIVKSLQFGIFFALGSGAPFFAIFFKKILVNANGTPATYWIGFLFLVQTFTGMISPLIAGYIADKFKIENRILTICAIMVCFSGILILIPGITELSSLPINFRLFILIAAMAINGLFIRPIVPLIDTETLTHLQNRDKHINKYHRIRVFGTVGWICSSCTMGIILFLTDYIIIAFIGYSASFLVLGGIAFSGIKSKIKSAKIPWHYLKNDTTMKFFLIFALLHSIGFSSSFNFMGYFLDDKHVNYFIIGLVYGLAAFLEVPVLLIGDKINRFLTLKTMLIINSLIQSLKLLLFFFVAQTNYSFLFIIINSVSGIGFGLYFYALVRFIDSLAHKDLRATYQSLYQSAMVIGSAIGIFFGSWVIENWDSQLLMLLASLIIIIAAIYFSFIPYKTTKSTDF